MRKYKLQHFQNSEVPGEKHCRNPTLREWTFPGEPHGLFPSEMHNKFVTVLQPNHMISLPRLPQVILYIRKIVIS